MAESLKTFLVNISIIEGRHYIWPNINSVVLVEVNNEKKYTAVKYNTDCPYYNEYFVFEFLSTLENMLDKIVTITVIVPGGILRKRKLLGHVIFDIATIWYQEDHQLYHKWAILTSTRKDLVGGTRGYLKLDVSVLTKGEVPKVPRFKNTDEIEGNLFIPHGATRERQRVNFLFDIYRGVDIVKKNPIQEGAKKTESLPSTHISISFSGATLSTKVQKNSSNPVWYERLNLPEYFPPLSQRFKIDLYHDGVKRSTRFLSLNTVSSDTEEGFLPTFGPSFLHFYSPNNLEGYLGKVLLSLQTELYGELAEYEAKDHLVQTEATPTSNELSLRHEKVVICATIFEVSSIIKKFSDKSISFRLSCGPQHVEDIDDNSFTTITQGYQPKMVNKNFSYLPILENKPFLQLTLMLPDIRKRMFNFNLLSKMLTEVKLRIERIENLFSNLGKDMTEIQSCLLETLDYINFYSQKYIDIVSNYNVDSPELYYQRIKMSLKKMEEIKSLSERITCCPRHKIFQKIEKISIKIESLIDIIEDWPKIYLWMIYGNKRVAYHIINPRDIIHSPISEEEGVHCRVFHTIYFQTEENRNIVPFISSACKMDLIIWMGLKRHAHSYLPPGFNFSADAVPRFLLTSEVYTFQGRAYIFQGRFTPGSDKSGLCDPFIEIIVSSQSRKTQVLKKTLTPVWDQILFFPGVKLYGSREFLAENSPLVYFEVYDKDEHKTELVGKGVVKTNIKFASDIQILPSLKWYTIYDKFDVVGEILAAFDLLETNESRDDPNAIVRLPPEIKPKFINHRIEVVFWGVRNLKKTRFCKISKPKIVIECGDVSLASDSLNAKKNLNFTNSVKMFEANFSEQEEFAPTLCLKMYDCRSFGITIFSGTHIVPVRQFLYTPYTALEREAKICLASSKSFDSAPSIEAIIDNMEQLQLAKNKKSEKLSRKCFAFFGKICNTKKKSVHTEIKIPDSIEALIDEDEEDTSSFDWWTKYYASLEPTPKNSKVPLSQKNRLKIYPNELEDQPEFSNFSDTLVSFRMYKGKRSGDEGIDKANTTGIFKGAIKIYNWPLDQSYVTPNGLPIEQGVFQDFPGNIPVRFVLRVYCVRAFNLRPKDLNGKSDPYVRLTFNKQVVSDRRSYIKGQVNPVFGKCFELSGVFPQDHTLVVAVMDYDTATADDLIGETTIDLENRFYTRHRAHCGIAEEYYTSGYCQWRDCQKPTTILDNLCRKYNINDLIYEEKFVRVACREFSPKNFQKSDDADLDREILALEALKHWSRIPIVGCSLVPEHIESRTLYHPNKPGIGQGKLQLWIDILPYGDLPIPKPVDITPLKPIPYELRVIIWNAENIVLNESDILGQGKKSDIFIKGWVVSSKFAQYTDVHYRSLSGEGNFNWRFIFRFDYLSSENKIVLKKTGFGGTEEEEKLPCRLTVQAWDNDTFSHDDFLGTLTMDLTKLSRSSYSAKATSVVETPVFINLFKLRRTKGWWPLTTYDYKTGKEIFAGALELEFDLLTKEEAFLNPAGYGRNEPQGLPKPNRPDSSFSWFHNPLTSLKYAWKLHRKKMVKIIIAILLIFIILTICYHLPEYGIKKLLLS